MHFIDVLIRQAHPGPGVPPYRNIAQKKKDARTYQVEGVPYPVLVDDVKGTVHQVYGGIADPSYVIDVDGRVAFYGTWTHAPTLHRALEALFKQGGRGQVLQGVDRVTHMLASMTDGWQGLRRGLPQSFTDLELSVPGMASSIWLGYQLRPILVPLTLRAKPLPVSVRVGLAIGVGVALGLSIKRLLR